ncbi:peptidylprolyl isomerase [Pelotomaculum isophthalicicum JI]|uniref:Peptidylprolyl isomerase n=1 Tax=Pelotomaculum isophthalicicum JI TaxID=947010 RepID=A0A9X4H328_9FIRM|nr:peptidylprolyl isomerase [Pelotomaculum isophthalicicum]MDF9407713.1 peptidylprolyl isomerase [Pelotomaculum isophthalicicum JI]
MHRKILPLTLAVLMIFALAGCGQDVVATVNGEKITGAELSQRVDEAKASMEKQGVDFSGDKGQTLTESLRKQTLDEMINNKLFLQEARKSGKLTKEQVQDKINIFKLQFTSTEEYNQFLAQIKMSEEDIAYILNMQDQVAKDIPPVSEDDVKKYYDENKEQFTHPEQLQVRHILFFVDDGSKGYPVQHTDAEARQMAEDVITQLKQGKDFAALAAEKSEDSGSKNNGGLYTFSAGDAVQEFADAASALSPGQFTQTPVKTEYGYHVIKMEKKIAAGQYPFEEIEQRLTEQLNQQAVSDKFSSMMQEAKNNAKITNKLTAKEGDTSKQ